MNLNSKKYTKYYILALISIIGLALYSNTNTVIEGADSDEERKKKFKRNEEKVMNAPPLLIALLVISSWVPGKCGKNGTRTALTMIYITMVKDNEIEKLIGGDGKQTITKRTEEEYEKILEKLRKIIFERIGMEY